MIKIGVKEKSTFAALNDISTEYPFAASLLVYAIIERVLKEYIIKNRKNRVVLNYDFCKYPGGLSLQKCHRYKKQDFVKKFIKRIAFGDAQSIVAANEKRNYAANRNDLMHSNSYLLEQKKFNKSKRHDINKQSYKTALSHLEFVINTFSDVKIVLRDQKILII